MPRDHPSAPGGAPGLLSARHAGDGQVASGAYTVGRRLGADGHYRIGGTAGGLGDAGTSVDQAQPSEDDLRAGQRLRRQDVMAEPYH